MNVCGHCYTVYAGAPACSTCGSTMVVGSAVRRLVAWRPVVSWLPFMQVEIGTLVLAETDRRVVFGLPGGRRLTVRREDIHFIETERLPNG